MEIKMLKVYQAVYLGPRLDTVFQTNPNAGNLSKAVKLEMLEGFGVKVSDAKHAIIVPFPNVAYVELAPEKVPERKAAKPA